MKEFIPIPEEAIGRLSFSDSPNLNYFHRHDELECNIVCSGRGSYLVDNHRIDLEPLSVAWLFPEQSHLLLDATEEFAMWVLVIRPSYLRQSCIDAESKLLLERKPAGLHLRHITPNAFQQLTNICQQVLDTQNQLALHNATLGYLIHSCWHHYQQGSMIPLSQHVHPAVDKIARRLQSGQERTDLSTLSVELGLTPETVSRLFRKQTGVALTTYRNRCRIERFLLLYGDGYGPTMLTAALTAGFGSYAQFYRVFTEVMGQTPATYRRQLRTHSRDNASLLRMESHYK